eukprot:CAMPEP_0197524166 /NCGR_PEP_ID=MMETSP1318-20131121/8913_1 /TAXON_ID=552666 /ORGANISM="Partenskyella glossopodia, Strain RCC365" /LENGTH=150 /DNA_ID=CAMNT_0043077053 /DNA_START=256 /DNA_END=708 /DNA_ORIENTATION=+
MHYDTIGEMYCRKTCAPARTRWDTSLDFEEEEEEGRWAGCKLSDIKADDRDYSDSGWESWPPVKFGDWGLVYVVGGDFAGQFVYYDDDEYEYDDDDDDEDKELDEIEDRPPRPPTHAAVYHGTPLLGPCHIIPHAWLRQPPFEGACTSLR